VSEVLERKVGIIACSGEELAEGTVARLAALRVLNELRPLAQPAVATATSRTIALKRSALKRSLQSNVARGPSRQPVSGIRWRPRPSAYEISTDSTPMRRILYRPSINSPSRP